MANKSNDINKNECAAHSYQANIEKVSQTLVERILSRQLNRGTKAQKIDYYNNVPSQVPYSSSARIMAASQFVMRIVNTSIPAPLVIAKTVGFGPTFSWDDLSSEYFPTAMEQVELFKLTEEVLEKIAAKSDDINITLKSLHDTNLYKSAQREVRAFLDSWVSHRFDFRAIGEASVVNHLSGDCVWHDYFLFIAALRKRCQHLELRKTLYDRNVREPRKRFVKLQGLLASLFERYSRILVVRVDLKYKSEYVQDIEFSDFHANIKKVSAAATQQKGNFKDCLGFALRLEEAPRTGLHCHAVFFFDGGLRHQDLTIAQAICLWWENTVTSGKGAGWNVNQYWKSQSADSPEKREQMVIGPVDRRDEEKVLKMVDAMGYLCIAGQDTVSKPKRNVRVFITKDLTSTGQQPGKKKQAVRSNT